MEEPQSWEDGSFLLSEPADLSRITTAIHQLLENDMALEAADTAVQTADASH